MTKENRTKLSKSWSGRLIDIGGVEGSLTLALSESKGKVQGTFDVILDGIHKPILRRGEITGSLQGSELELALSLGSKEYPVTISFAGKLRVARNQEMVVKGIYSVVFRRYPGALLGGVLFARSQPKEGNARTPLYRWTTVEVTSQRPDQVTANNTAATKRRIPARKDGKARSTSQVHSA